MARGKQVAEGIWWVGCGSWGGLTEVLSDPGSGNVFLVGGKGSYTLIDAGAPEGVQAVVANCAAVGAGAGSIRRILLTHTHSDHAAGAAALMQATGAPLAASELASRALGGDEDTCRRLMFRGPTVQVAEVLRDGDELSLGPYRFAVLLTPGHIPDSVTLVGQVGGRKVALTGDTVIGDQGEARGVVGWLDGHWGSNPKHLARSIERIAGCRADLMLPGHGFPLQPAEKVAESLRHCAERVGQLLAIDHLGSMMPLDLSE